MIPRNSKLADELEGFNPVTERQREDARLTVCDHVARVGGDADDAAELMRILGIYPGEVDDDGFTVNHPLPPSCWPKAVSR